MVTPLPVLPVTLPLPWLRMVPPPVRVPLLLMVPLLVTVLPELTVRVPPLSTVMLPVRAAPSGMVRVAPLVTVRFLLLSWLSGRVTLPYTLLSIMAEQPLVLAWMPPVVVMTALPFSPVEKLPAFPWLLE